LIASTYVWFVRPIYTADHYGQLLAGLTLGITVQAGAFWLNVALGMSYSRSHFVDIGLAVTVQRFLGVLLAFLAGFAGVQPMLLMAGLVGYFVLSSIVVFVRYRVSASATSQPTGSRSSSLAKLIIDSISFVKWSLLATAVFLFPVTAIAAIAPQQLVPATLAFFIAGAIQNLIAALITPQANTLQDGVGDTEVLKRYFFFTMKMVLCVTGSAVVVLVAAAPFCGTYLSDSLCGDFLNSAVVLSVAAGIRSITLVPTQAAIALKQEHRLMLSPTLEAAVSAVGVTLCWMFKSAHLIVWVFAVSVVVRVSCAYWIDRRIVSGLWVKKNVAG
jgi:hypothetical protein